jgi:hypothetical protein
VGKWSGEIVLREGQVEGGLSTREAEKARPEATKEATAVSHRGSPTVRPAEPASRHATESSERADAGGPGRDRSTQGSEV